MAKLMSRPSIELEVALILTEEEARALEALGGYGDDAFIKVFYQGLGKHYLSPHEDGLRSLLNSARSQLPAILTRTDEARAVFAGAKIARPHDKPKVA